MTRRWIVGSDITREMLESGDLQPKIESALRLSEEPGEGYVEGVG